MEPQNPQAEPPRVAIVGGGFGGLYATQRLKKSPVRVTLIDRRNFHLFQPLLYQVATGALSPANIATPLRALLKRQKNTQVLLGDVVDVDVDGRRVRLSDGTEIAYDYLVVAAGTRHHYFGKPEWEKWAPGLKTIEDATHIRGLLLRAFEMAERTTDPEVRGACLTFVVVGGGPTGVELAGALAELSRHTLRNEFRSIDPADARILLLEGADRILLSFPPDLSAKAARQLVRLGVSVLTGSVVTNLEPGKVEFRHEETVKQIEAQTVLWGAGVLASPLGAQLAKAAGIVPDRAGRVPVEPDLTVKGHPEVFVIGDLALCLDAEGKALPGVAPVAMQQGKYVARLIDQRLQGRTTAPFRYRDKGNLATIGRAAAVADLQWAHFSGLTAWLLWLFIHILYLVRFESRVLVMLQWAWNYFTRNRSARLITGSDATSQEAPK